MKSEHLGEAIGQIDDDIIKEADEMAERNKQKSRKPIWITLGSVAACGAIAATVLLNINRETVPTDSGSTSASTSATTSTTTSATTSAADTDEPSDSAETPEAGLTLEAVGTAEIDVPTDDIIDDTGGGSTTEQPGDDTGATGEAPPVDDDGGDTGEAPPVDDDGGRVEIVDFGDYLQLAKTEFPTFRKPVYDEVSDYEVYKEAYNAYRPQQQKLEHGTMKYLKMISDEFFGDSMSVFLSRNEGENAAFSPANLYMALAMTAETAGGESRQQILDVLGAESIEELRECARSLWNNTYVRSDVNETLLANSMWFSDGLEYDTKTLQRLIDYYYASAYAGDMNSEKFLDVFRGWLNEHTGGLLSDDIGGLALSPNTVFGIASTVSYNAQWENEFFEKLNTEGVFTKTDGTEQQAEFMNRYTEDYYYYDGDGYIATSIPLQDSDDMWLILPDEGVTPEQLARDGALYDFLYGGVRDNSLNCRMNFSMPKFDISSNGDLSEGLKELGITDVFDKNVSDFSPLAVNADGSVYINKVDSSVRVSVDEKGVSAASFIHIEIGVDGLPSEDEIPLIDFTLDRPFIFVIETTAQQYTQLEELPLFCGVVNSVQ